MPDFTAKKSDVRPATGCTGCFYIYNIYIYMFVSLAARCAMSTFSLMMIVQRFVHISAYCLHFPCVIYYIVIQCSWFMNMFNLFFSICIICFFPCASCFQAVSYHFGVFSWCIPPGFRRFPMGFPGHLLLHLLWIAPVVCYGRLKLGREVAEKWEHEPESAKLISGWWFQNCLFSTIYGIILPIDWYFSRWLKPPTRYLMGFIADL